MKASSASSWEVPPPRVSYYRINFSLTIIPKPASQTLDLVAVIAVGIWGIVLTAKSGNSSPCAANPNMNTQIQRVAIVNLVLAILVVLRVLRGYVQPNPA